MSLRTFVVTKQSLIYIPNFDGLKVSVEIMYWKKFEKKNLLAKYY